MVEVVCYCDYANKETKQRGITEEYEIHSYDALIGGELKKQVLARLSVPEGAGKRFLDRFPNQEDWPDLEEEEGFEEVAHNHRPEEMAKKETGAPESDVMEKPSDETSIKENNVLERWELDIDACWSMRTNTSGDSISGPVAAADAIKVLGVKKLKESQYKTLRSLLKGSQHLYTKWSYDNNRIIRN